jgi:virginiamycin B lyase
MDRLLVLLIIAHAISLGWSRNLHQRIELCECFLELPLRNSAAPDSDLILVALNSLWPGFDILFPMLSKAGLGLLLSGILSAQPSPIASSYPLPTRCNPYAMVTGPDGALWFTETYVNKIGRITTSGALNEFSLPSGSAEGIVVGADGALWFTEPDANKIGRITTAGLVSEYSLPMPNSDPKGIALGADNALWFGEANLLGGRIGRITTAGVVTDYNVGDGFPISITSGPDGAVWFLVVDSSNGFGIGRMATDGTRSLYKTAAASFAIQAITTGPDGALWFTEDSGNIGRFTTAGSLTEYALTTPAAYATNIITGPDGALWFTEKTGVQNGTVSGNGAIGRITLGGTITEYPLQGPAGDLGGIAVGTDGSIWFTKDSGIPDVVGRLAPTSLSFLNALRVPQIADGSSWKTLFQIVNLDQTSVSYSTQFWDDNGNPLRLPILNGSTGVFAGTLAPGGTAFAETPGASPMLAQGWAEVASTGRIGVLAIFRQSVQGRPDSEGTITATPSGSQVFLPFDNTSGYVTGVAVANTSTTQPLSMSLLFQMSDGSQSRSTLTLSAHAHTAFVLTSMFPSLAGLRGLIQFTASTPDLAVVGLRFSPTSSFTSLESFQ